MIGNYISVLVSTIGRLMLFSGIFVFFAVAGFYRYLRKGRLSQKEFAKAIVFVAAPAFISGVGLTIMSLPSLLTPEMLSTEWFSEGWIQGWLLAVSSVLCFSLGVPFSVVVIFISGMKPFVQSPDGDNVQNNDEN